MSDRGTCAICKQNKDVTLVGGIYVCGVCLIEADRKAKDGGGLNDS